MIFMKKHQKIILYLSIPLLFILAIFGYNKIFKKEKMGDFSSASPVQTPSVARGLPVSAYIVENRMVEDGNVRLGSLVASEKVDVVSELSGRVISINFIEGQHVKRGDVLVQLNDDELQIQLVRSEYQHTLLQERLERQRILLERDAVSREEYDKVLTEFNVLIQDMEQLKVRIEKMKIRAPFDGVVGFRDVSPGAFLQPGSKITNLVDVANIIVETAIPEKYARENYLGGELLFNIDGMNRDFKAVIYAVDPQIDVDTRTVRIRARYNNRDEMLSPGMFARITSNVSGSNSLFVPNESVIPDIRGRSVWVNRGNQVTLVPITIGVRNEDMVEVLSGLNKGDTVITTGLMQLREGMVVSITNLKPI